MQKHLAALALVIAFFISNQNTLAQNNVGIGTTTPRASSILEVKSDNQGILIPRVDTVSLQPSLVGLDHGLIVFDTVIGEMFVWNGVKFISLSAANPSLQEAYDAGQSINMGSGNIDFISSTANSVLFINEVNENVGIGTNTPNASYKLDVSGGDVLIHGNTVGRGGGNLLSNTVFGDGALANNTTGAANTAIGNVALSNNTNGQSNVAVGINTMRSMSIGQENVALGASAMDGITSGSANTIVGQGAYGLGTTGNNNTALGRQSLLINEGNSNTAIGVNTMRNNTTGSLNTTLGASAEVALGGLNNATAIGANTVVGASNSLVLGNNANVGIGTSTPVNKLEVVGDAAKFDSVIIANNAQAGYVLTAADASGAASWQPAVAGSSWDLLGNAGTNPANDFLGTTDNTSLVLRTNNTAKLTINPNGDIDMLGAELRMFDAALGFGTTKIVNTGIGSVIESYDPHHAIYMREAYDGSLDRLELHEVGSIGFFTGGLLPAQVERMHISNTGTIGIGTSTPNTNYKLDVVGGDAIINNLTVGRGSGNDISNTAFGNQALAANLAAGLANTAIGQSALSSNTTGTSSTALGFYALRLNTTGYSNVAVGHGALDNNSIGFENTALGQGALQGNTTGNRNTSIGRGTLTNNTTGSYNIAMGWEALVGHQSGNYNTAIGNDVLRDNVSGSNNSGLGAFALRFTTGGNNTGIGNGTLQTNTTGSDNTAIGFSADVASGGLTNATAIGANTVVGASNSLVLGNNANVGIGTSTPANKLEVIGNAAKFDSVIIANNAQAGYVLTAADASGAASWQPGAGSPTLQSAYDGGQTVNMGTGNINFISSAANSVFYVDETNERIGIGNATPTQKLDVSGGNINLDGTSFYAQAGAHLISQTSSNQNLSVGNGALLGLTTGGNNTAVGFDAGNFLDAGLDNTVMGYRAGQLIGNGSFNTMLGKDAGTNAFNVNSNTFIGQEAGAALTTGNGNTFIGRQTGASTATGSNNTAIGTNANIADGINNATAIGANSFASGNSTIILGSTENVGINNSNPQDKLYVQSNISNGGITINNNANPGDPTIKFAALGLNRWTMGFDDDDADAFKIANAGDLNSNVYLNIESGGNVGIGTSTPNTAFKLDVSGGDAIINSLTVGRGSGANINNTVIGLSTLQSNTTGTANSAFGSGALQNNIDGNNNSALGLSSLQSNTSGADNVGIGYQALFSNSSGNWNSAIGAAALRATTTGARNVGIGIQAGDLNVAGNQNTFLGANSNPSVGGLTNATAIGANAIVDASNEIQLGAVGTAVQIDGPLLPAGTAGTAGQVLTSAGPGLTPTWAAAAGGWGLTGNAGTINGTNFIGTTDNIPLSFRFNNLPSGRIDGISTSLGQGALSSLTTGIDNTAFGVSALQTNSIGIRNTAIGKDALLSNTTGSSNIGIGYQSLNFNTVGVENTATGYQALQFNIGGSSNTANGTTALYQNTSGSFNTGIGYQSLFQNTIGINNTANGTWALENNTTGNNNTSIGFQSLNINTTGSDNTAIGANADVASAALTNATAIGANAIVGASNSMVLGGTGVNAVKVGIGTTTPIGDLQVTRENSQANIAGFTYSAVNDDSPNLYLIRSRGTEAVPSALLLGDRLGEVGFIGETGGGISEPSAAIRVLATENFNGSAQGTEMLFRTIGNGEATPSNRMAINGDGSLTIDNLATGGPNEMVVAGSGGVLSTQVIPGGWGLTGNAGTVDGTNFIGTTDFVALNFRVGGLPSGRIDPVGIQANTFFGYSSGSLNTGTLSTGLGYQTLQNNTGSNNTAVGSYSMINNTSGFANTAMGGGAMRFNTTGAVNSGYGVNTLYQNTTGNNNTAIGGNAMLQNTTGSENTAIGTQAMQLGSSGNSNTATGFYALLQNNADNNVAMGTRALESNTTGTGNTAIGYFSGYTTTFANANVTGSNNTFIGYNSGPDSPTQLTNATAIGANAKVNADNSLILGSGANVGIGTTTPIALLDVDGSFNGARINSWMSIGSSIGGSAYVGTNLYRNFADNQWTYTNTHGAIGGAAIIFNNLEGPGTENDIAFVRTTTPGTANALATVQESMRIKQNGKVGIGTSTPGLIENALLEVNGTIHSEENFTLKNTNSASGTTNAAFRIDGWQDRLEIIAESNANGSVNGTEIGFHTANANQVSDLKVIINKFGNVGIGTFSPSYKLELPNIANSGGQGLANSWVTYSDGRVKSNQKTINYGLNSLMKMLPKSYHHHSSEFENGELIIKEGSNSLGLIAQELYEIIPEAVAKPKDESIELWSVDYNKLVPVLIKATQEQQVLIENQELRITEFEKQLAKTNEENTSLKASSSVSKSSTETELLQAQLNEMKAQIERLNTILSSEAKK